MTLSFGLVIKLLLLGAIIASVPLSIAWVRGGAGNRYRKLVWLTLFLTFDLIVFGAFTRLTDSGLGCPDWPGCYGHADPLTAATHIRAAEAAAPNGPVTMTKATIEMIHRYLAMAVGALILALALLAWSLRRKPATTATHAAWNDSPWPATAVFILVCVQGAFGAWTVTLKLMPVIVTIHLLLGLTLLAALTWLAVRTQTTQDPRESTALQPLRKFIVIGFALLIAQIALGGWVSTNYAALACPDLPFCQGKLIPPMNFSEAFELNRDLGRTSTGALLPASALTAMHWLHRLGALMCLLYLGWLGSRITRAERAAGVPKPRTAGRWLHYALGAQILIGLSVVAFNHPIAIATLHNAVAALLVGVMTVVLVRATIHANSRE